MDRDDLIEHLKFAKELGVSGVSTDPAWRERDDASVGASGFRRTCGWQPATSGLKPDP